MLRRERFSLPTFQPFAYKWRRLTLLFLSYLRVMFFTTNLAILCDHRRKICLHADVCMHQTSPIPKVAETAQCRRQAISSVLGATKSPRRATERGLDRASFRLPVDKWLPTHRQELHLDVCLQPTWVASSPRNRTGLARIAPDGRPNTRWDGQK